MELSCKKIAEDILDEVREEAAGLNLCLAAVLVGDDPGLRRFVGLKERAVDSTGIGFKLIQLPQSVSQPEIEGLVRELDKDPGINGIFVELPLPANLDSQKILNLVSKSKDVDMLSDESGSNFEEGDFRVLPPTVQAIKTILARLEVEPDGKRVAIFGTGNLVGRPASFWFKKTGAEVFEIDEFTENPEEFSKKADIIIAGVGKPGLIKSSMIKEGAIIFDFGYGAEGGKIKGDVADDVDDVKSKAGFVTPVPGGVGAIVIASVLKNLIILNK